MSVRTAALSFTFTVFAATALAAAPSNNFTLVNQAGKPIGSASYSINKTKDGFKVQSRFEYHLAAAPDAAAVDATTSSMATQRGARATGLLGGQYTGEYKLDADDGFLSGFIQDQSTQTMTAFQLNKKRDSMTISRMQGGSSGGGSDLSVPVPEFLLAPDYDPSVLQVLLTTALTHPRPDSTYLLITPGAGSNGQNALNRVVIQPAADSPAGTLDRKPIALKHYLMNYQSGHADLYADADGNLMDAVMGPLDVSYVRAKFALTKP